MRCCATISTNASDCTRRAGAGGDAAEAQAHADGLLIRARAAKFDTAVMRQTLDTEAENLRRTLAKGEAA